MSDMRQEEDGLIYFVSGIGGCICIMGGIITALTSIKRGDYAAAICAGLILVGVYNLIVAHNALKRMV